MRIIMYGLSGAISVMAATSSAKCQVLAHWTDDQIASVLTYLRREWGHTAAPVDPEARQVHPHRDGGTGKSLGLERTESLSAIAHSLESHV